MSRGVEIPGTPNEGGLVAPRTIRVNGREFEVTTLGGERRMIWPAGITAADLHVAMHYLDCAAIGTDDDGDRRSLRRVLDAVRNEYESRKRAAIAAATPGGRRARRRVVK